MKSGASRPALALASLALATFVLTGVSTGKPSDPLVLRSARTLESGLGVSIHGLAEPDAELSMMANAGIHLVRLDLSWHKIEKVRGQYDWSAYDTLVKAVLARRMRPILILGYSNPLYADIETGAAKTQWLPPKSPASIAAYANWAAAAAAHFEYADPILEIWNEPNHDGFWPPRASSAEYLDLANAACAAMRQATPKATIWAPALANTPDQPAMRSAFLAAVLNSPLRACANAISIHPYLFKHALDSSPAFWQGLRALPGAQGTRFVSSESGLSASGPISPTAQASYLARMFLYDLASGIPTTVWYDWRNTGPARSSVQDNFGLIDWAGRPKPAYRALVTLARQTANRDRQCFTRTAGQTRLYFWGSQRPDDQLMIVWTTPLADDVETDAMTDIQLPARASSPTATDLFEQPLTLLDKTGQSWRIRGGTMPYFIHYRGPREPRCA